MSESVAEHKYKARGRTDRQQAGRHSSVEKRKRKPENHQQSEDFLTFKSIFAIVYTKDVVLTLQSGLLAIFADYLLTSILYLGREREGCV